MSTATQLRFKNTEPTPAHKEILLKALEDVEHFGSENTVVRARLKQRGGNFVAQARVHMGRTFFKAQVSGKNVKELASQLRHRLLQQMERWRSTRRRKRERLSHSAKRSERLRILEHNFAER
ncbi:MAG: hypothetical protein KDD34_02905 [Bdellovibrionales bacterium]|nr:hypothetical protein [Bdellovibrionales bacterium]